jgi:hypothetical protein
LLGGDTAGGVVDEHHLEKVESGTTEGRHERDRLISLPLGE